MADNKEKIDMEEYKRILKQELKDELLKEIFQELKSEKVDASSKDSIVHAKPEIPLSDEELAHVTKAVPSKKVADASKADITLTVRVFLKIAIHALKYANKNIPRENWVEVIGLLAGKLDENGKKLHVEEIYPMGHGNAVYAEIKDYKNFVRAYNDLREKQLFICGWYHSHPSYGLFLSDEDMGTQSRYQRLWDQSIALVIDPYQIDGTSFGFNIFRADLRTQKWFPVSYSFTSAIDAKIIPDLVEFVAPLSEGKALYLEYDEGG